jgi:hypothetical protein
MMNLKCLIAATRFAPPPPFPLPTEQKMNLVNFLQNEHDEFYWQTHTASSSSKNETEMPEKRDYHDTNDEVVEGIQLRVNEAWLEKLGPTVDRLMTKCNGSSKTQSKVRGKRRGNFKKCRRGKKFQKT